jgi:predicted kinase
VSRLIHLNGPPAVGKTTLARRWADEHPGTLLCDIDAVRQMIGGWESRPDSAELSRTVGLAMITEHLRTGHDVVLPQLVALPDQLARFRAAADNAGASYVVVLLIAPADEVARRFDERDDAAAPGDRWAAFVRAFWEGGGADEVGATTARLDDLADRSWIRVESTTPEATYDALVAAVDG